MGTLTSRPAPPVGGSRPPTAAPSTLRRRRRGSPWPHRCPAARRAVEGKAEPGWSRVAGWGGWEETGSCRAWPGMKVGSSDRTRRHRTGVLAASGEELGCSSTLNPPQVSSGAGEGDNPTKAPATGMGEPAPGMGSTGQSGQDTLREGEHIVSNASHREREERGTRGVCQLDTHLHQAVTHQPQEQPGPVVLPHQCRVL